MGSDPDFIHSRSDQCETSSGKLAASNMPAENCRTMELCRATALIALILIVVLAAGYAAGERVEPEASLPEIAFADLHL